VRDETRKEELERLSGFLNFAGLNARRAHTDTLGRASDHRMDGLQVDVPAPLSDVVGVADAVSELRTAHTNFTHFRHDSIAPTG
jgi:hypothetical protein